jgi:cyclophilin family peptidyl-prolyl cis-trans isomerase
MITRRFLVFGAGLVAAARPGIGAHGEEKAGSKKPVVVLETSRGRIEIELNTDKAPITVKNFLDYVQEKHYDGLVFHRVIPGFMVQGGGFSPDMEQKKTREPIKNEAGNGLKNDRGTIAMARTSDPDSASAQFFINVKDNVFLNHRSDAPQEFGYAVFGKVTAGMDVVDKIVAAKTKSVGPFENVPVVPIVIKTARLKQ